MQAIASVPSSLLPPSSSQSPLPPFVRTPGSVVNRALRPTRPFGLFVCSWVWFTRTAWKTRSCRLGGVPKQKIIREASNVALIGNVGRPNHLVPHRQDPEPQISLEVEIFFPLVLGRPPNHEFSEHKIRQDCIALWQDVKKKIRSRHPDRLLCLLLQKMPVGRDVYLNLVGRSTWQINCLIQSIIDCFSWYKIQTITEIIRIRHLRMQSLGRAQKIQNASLLAVDTPCKNLSVWEGSCLAGVNPSFTCVCAAPYLSF